MTKTKIYVWDRIEGNDRVIDVYFSRPAKFSYIDWIQEENRMSGFKIKTFGTATSQGIVIETGDGVVTIHTDDMSYAHELADAIEEYATEVEVEG